MFITKNTIKKIYEIVNLLNQIVSDLKPKEIGLTKSSQSIAYKSKNNIGCTCSQARKCNFCRFIKIEAKIIQALEQAQDNLTDHKNLYI